jgi:8-hydroxy-5-deazaflavin:NADPH oxidoreductase
MRIGILGSGRIGSNIGERLAIAGHAVVFSGSRNPTRLDALAASSPGATAASPAEAVASCEVIVFSVPWTQIDDVLGQTGPLDGRIVIDTTNQFGLSGIETLDGKSALETNSRRMPGAHLGKAFNTYTSGFQRDVADRRVAGEVAMFHSSFDESTAEVTAKLVADCGFVPVRLDPTRVTLMEAPRRPGAVYGEAYRPEDARRIATAATDDLGLAQRLADRLKLVS